jgi:hypothetical protein
MTKIYQYSALLFGIAMAWLVIWLGDKPPKKFEDNEHKCENVQIIIPEKTDQIVRKQATDNVVNITDAIVNRGR